MSWSLVNHSRSSGVISCTWNQTKSGKVVFCVIIVTLVYGGREAYDLVEPILSVHNLYYVKMVHNGIER